MDNTGSPTHARRSEAIEQEVSTATTHGIAKSDRDYQCFEKARAKGEPTFTLRAQDRSAPGIICKWITANIETAPGNMLRDALEDAIAMRDWPGRKAAD